VDSRVAANAPMRQIAPNTQTHSHTDTNTNTDNNIDTNSDSNSWTVQEQEQQQHQQVPYNPEQFIPEFDVNDGNYQEE